MTQVGNRFRCVAAIFIAICCVNSGLSYASADDKLGIAVRQAVGRIDPSVVRIRAVGSEQNTDGGNVNTAASTGIVVSTDGDIITSAFSVQGRPQAILVETINGKRIPAEIIATDFVRKLVLIKAAQGEWIPIPRSNSETSKGIVGQWAIAVGRFYLSSASNVSVGVISALNRVHGMAIQTDAKISPVNYGGPLIDLDGNTLGVLVPLSPRDRDSVDSGVEWYDSGIGFAIPLNDVFEIANRLKSSGDLKPGKLGISLHSASIFSADVRIQAVHPGGPSALAGLQKGDRIESVNGQMISRSAVLESVIASSYAGDRIELGILRGEQHLSFEIVLSDKLPIVTPGYIGLLPIAKRQPVEQVQPNDGKNLPNVDEPKTDLPPVNTLKDAEQPEPESLLAIVLDGTSASESGMKGVVQLESVNSLAVNSPAVVRQTLNELPPGSQTTVTYRLSDGTSDDLKQSTTTKLTLSGQPGEVRAIPKESLAAYRGDEQDIAVLDILESARPPKRHDITVGEDGHIIVLDPALSDSDRAPGLLVLLSSAGQSEESLLRKWQGVMNSHHLAIAIPRNPEGIRLTSEDLRLVAIGTAKATNELGMDATRLLIAAEKQESEMAATLIYARRSPFRGVAMLNGWLTPLADQSLESQTGRSVLILDNPADRQTRALQTLAVRTMSESGLRVFSVPAASSDEESSESAIRAIADWSLIMKSL